MSKRRKTKKEKPASETEVVDKPGKEESRERGGIPGNRKVLLYSAVIAAAFFVIGFLVGPALTGQFFVQTSGNDMLIFISPPSCTNCDQLEPIAKGVANTLGIPFVKTGFGQQLESPGFALIYEDKYLGTTGFDSEYSLNVVVCQMSENEDVCNRAEELEPAEQPQELPPPPEVPKSDRPEAHAFVMSYCPYGLQFMKAYIPVIELLGDKADIELNFVHYIMHGEKEMTENTRIHCIQKEEEAKFTDYLRCFVEFDDPEKCMSEAGIDSGKIDTCMQATDEEFDLTKTFQESTERFPRYSVDAALAELYGVSGSPTFGINGQQVQVNRSPEAIKQAVCAAFNSPPEECSQALSSAPEAPGIGPVGSGSGSGSQAQC